MKILVVSNLYPPNVVGGYERLCASIVDELVRRGHEASVLTSDYGDVPATDDRVPVDRSLKLLATRANIYAPFVATDEERADINRHNRETLRRVVHATRPDAVFVSNLHFFDRSLLEGLDRYDRKAVYLLTDVWRIDFESPDFLHRFFREHVVAADASTEPLVGADPGALVVDWFDTPDSFRDYVSKSAVEIGRRRRWEREGSGTPSVVQRSGTCFLCGPSTFRIEQAGPLDLMLPARDRLRCTCARCDLDAPYRVGLHVLEERLPDVEESDLLVMTDEGPAARAIARSLPAARVCDLGADPAGLFADGARPRCALVVASARGEGRLEALLPTLRSQVATGGTVVVAGPALDVTSDLSGAFRLRDGAHGFGYVGGRVGLVWSGEYGYLGREYRMLVLGVP